jgi:hypothetical protein
VERRDADSDTGIGGTREIVCATSASLLENDVVALASKADFDGANGISSLEFPFVGFDGPHKPVAPSS